ncbi:MAG: hypothetical protein IJ489_00235, partial [Clostridia bacterium]|nr:hypothetical protein [Clostridia bacterium]
RFTLAECFVQVQCVQFARTECFVHFYLEFSLSLLVGEVQTRFIWRLPKFTPKPLLGAKKAPRMKNKKALKTQCFQGFSLVAGVGFEPHDLRVMRERHIQLWNNLRINRPGKRDLGTYREHNFAGAPNCR